MKILGNGSIVPLEDGPRCNKWRLFVFVSDNGKRKQRTKTVYCGKREARRALELFKQELSEEIEETKTFAGYCKQWRQWRIDSGAYSVDTIRNDRTKCNVLCLELGNKDIGHISAQDCRSALFSLRSSRNWSQTTLHSYHTFLYGIFQTAYHDGDIQEHPMLRLPWPKKDTAERAYLSPEELDRLWLSVEEKLPLDGMSMAIFLMIDAGLRRGEVCWLKTKDVHDTYLVVSRSKTSAGCGRSVPLTERLIAKCKQWQTIREQFGYGDALSFCCSPQGMVMHRANLQAWWDHNRKKIGFPKLTMHEIRHSNCSKMARYMGVHELMRWAGWKDIKMAMRYVHDDLPALEAAVRRSQFQKIRFDGPTQNSVSESIV